MGTLDDWTEALCAELGLDPAEATQKTVLDLARVVAHTVDRPAAPLTALLARPRGRRWGTVGGNSREGPAACPRLVRRP